MKELFGIGKVSKLFGNEGGVYINTRGAAHPGIKIGEPLYVKIDMLTVPLFVASISRRGNKGAVVIFDDIDTVGRAEELIGLELLMAGEPGKDSEPESDDNEGLYFDSLVGYSALVEGAGMGEVVDFVDSEFNPLLIIELEGRQVMIPAVNEFITDIDPMNRELRLTLPEGLLDL